MHYASQELNGVHSSVANVGVSEKNGFNFQHHEKDLFDVPASCLNFDSQNMMCESSGDQSAPLFGSVVDSFFSSHGDTFCELYEHFRNKQNDILEGDASAPVNRVGDSSSSMVPIATRKKGIKWTKDLHELFVAAVNCLGGAQSNFKSFQFDFLTFLN
uniref:Uncharacterized protein n=1 Tax=Phaseolus vulgaris TaxID=3885 RepID=V7BM76_PHAVU|nr:hypothetical protein PHAVU_007G258600g [Phaseolus vulgaris]ESW17666.1 hypothetical protein PHAVU_007G258600g [Phaseolus vulgaris]